MHVKPAARQETVEDAKFDRYAGDYDALHAASISASGEASSYFAEYKLHCLERLGLPASEPILDYGCGVGNLTEQLVKQYRDVHGYDPSLDSLKVAETRVPMARFHENIEGVPRRAFAAAILSGVLHHVQPADRPHLLAQVQETLKPGGRIIVFEHNPYNPLTRRAVATCEFDDDAVLLWPGQLRKTLASAGFIDVDLKYIVFFPRFLAFLRPLEPRLSRFMLGAQTMCVATRRS